MPTPSPSIPATPADDAYDVVVLGGALSGAAFALLLRRWRPDCRVLVVERAPCFGRKVGEATVEVSGFFLQRVLRLGDYLEREHLPKHGLRFWFTDRPDRPLAEMTEIGPREVPRLPSFQLDRARLDEHLLATAERAGCEVLRPARAIAVELGEAESGGSERGRPTSRVRVEIGGSERCVETRWVVDATGRHAFLARRLRLHRRTEEHPTAAAWARWRDVPDLDGPEVLGDDPRAPRLPELVPSRRLATNHFCGYGWWCWAIPLAGGETSVGVVYHKELFDLPGTGSPRERYHDFVTTRAGLRELLAPATMDEDDFMAYRHLPYRSTRYAGRGWALLGDAAGFIDPFYSPGLDHAAMSIYATARLIEQDLAGRDDELDEALAVHNGAFTRSYDRWLDALYLGKYEILGDAELTRCAFLLDTALYYLGVVDPVYRQLEALGNPVFGLDKPQATVAYRLVRVYNRRLRRLARLRRLDGSYGRGNIGRRVYSPAFDLGPAAALRFLARGAGLWLRLEAEQLLRRPWLRRRDVSRPVPAAGAPQPAP